MKRLFKKPYDWLGIETNDSNWMQLLFGEHLGKLILLGMAMWIFIIRNVFPDYKNN